MFDALVGQDARTNLKQYSSLIVPRASGMQRSTSTPSDSDMVAAMASRLRSLERQLQLANDELQARVLG